MGSDSAMEAVLAAAARGELGALLDSWKTGNFRLAKGKEMAHRFEHGLVVDRGAKKGPLALPFRDTRIYREFNPTLSGAGEPLFTWKFESSDGQTWTALVNERAWGKKNSALLQKYNEILGLTCATQRQAALQRLDEGAALTFGPVELDRSQITLDGHEYTSWVSVVELSVKRKKDSPALVISVAHEGVFKNTRRLDVYMSEIPNFPLLWKLANLSHINARAAQ